MSLQTRPAAESGESSSRISRPAVTTAFEEDNDFQEPIVLQPRTTRTASPRTGRVKASTESTGISMTNELHF